LLPIQEGPDRGSGVHRSGPGAAGSDPTVSIVVSPSARRPSKRSARPPALDWPTAGPG